MTHPPPNPIAAIADTDWIVCVTMRGGAVSKYRVSPGTLPDDVAAMRAIRSAAIPLANVDAVRVCRASEHVRVVVEDYGAQLRHLMKG